MAMRTATRYAIAAAILLVIGGLFALREFRDPDADAGASDRIGLLDGRDAAIGEPAPDFALRGLDGEVVRLSDFHGRIVVLNFWASWCPPCRAEMPEFQAAYEERLPDGDFAVLAVDLLAEDTEQAARGFVEEFGLTFPVAFDTADSDVARRYRVRGLPATYFIDRQGVVRARTLGPVFGDLLPQGIAAADTGTSID